MMLSVPVSPRPVRPRHPAQCQPCCQQGAVLGVAGDPGGSLDDQPPPSPPAAARIHSYH